MVELNDYNYKNVAHGEMAERLKAPVLKFQLTPTFKTIHILIKSLLIL